MSIYLSDRYIKMVAEGLSAKTGRHPLWIERRFKEALAQFRESGRVAEGYLPFQPYLTPGASISQAQQ